MLTRWGRGIAKHRPTVWVRAKYAVVLCPLLQNKKAPHLQSGREWCIGIIPWTGESFSSKNARCICLSVSLSAPHWALRTAMVHNRYNTETWEGEGTSAYLPPPPVLSAFPTSLKEKARSTELYCLSSQGTQRVDQKPFPVLFALEQPTAWGCSPHTMHGRISWKCCMQIWWEIYSQLRFVFP